MKQTLAILVFALAVWNARASDVTVYGAWWTTFNSSPGTPKGAGQMLVAIYDGSEYATRHGGIIQFDVTDFNSEGAIAKTTYTGNWSWSSQSPKFIKFDLHDTSNGKPKIIGKFNIVSGQLTGTYKRIGLFSGKLQGVQASIPIQ